MSTGYSFPDRQPGFNQETFILNDRIEIAGHLFPVFPPGFIRIFPGSHWDKRLCIQGFPDLLMPFFGIVSPARDISLRLAYFIWHIFGRIIAWRDSRTGLFDIANPVIDCKPISTAIESSRNVFSVFLLSSNDSGSLMTW